MPDAAVRLRILIVYSERNDADALATLIQASGHEARAEYYDQGALGAAAAFRAQVIFVDTTMPGMNGTRVPAEMKSRAGARTLVAALTGPTDHAAREQALLAGFDHVLIKPDYAAQLGPILAEAVALHSLAAE